MAAAKGGGEKPAGKGGGKPAGGKKDVGNKLNPNDSKAKGAAATATAPNADGKQSQPPFSGDANPSSFEGGPEAASNPGGIFFPPHWNTKLSLKSTVPTTQQQPASNNGMIDAAASSISTMAATAVTETESDGDITKMEPFNIVTDDLATVMVLLECPELHIVMKVLDNLYKRMDNNLAEKQLFLARHGLEKILFYTQHVRMPLVRRATVLVGLLAMNEECHDDMLKVENGAVVPLMLALLIPNMDRVVHEWSTLALARLSEHSLTRYLLVYDFNGARMLQRTLQPMKQAGGGGDGNADPDVVLNTLIIWQHLLEEDSISEDTKKLQLNRVLDACREQLRTSVFVRLKFAALKVMTLAANVKTYRDYLLSLKMLEELKTLLFDEPNCETPEACYGLLANLFYDTNVQADFEDSGLLYAIVNHLYTYAPQPKPTSAATAALAAAAAAAAAADADEPVDTDTPAGATTAGVGGAPSAAASSASKLDKIAEYAVQIVALSSRIPDMAWVLSKKQVDKLLIWFIENATTEQTANLRSWAFVALKHLSAISSSRKVMMQSRLGHAVLKALTREVSHDAGMERLLQFLARFAQQDEECGRYLLENGVVTELVRQLRKFNVGNNSASSSTGVPVTGANGPAPPAIITPASTNAPPPPAVVALDGDASQQNQQQQPQHRSQRHLNYLDDARVQANMIGVFTSLGMFARLMRDINQQYRFTAELAQILTRCDDAPYLLEQTIMALQLYMQQPRARHEFVTTPVPVNNSVATKSIAVPLTIVQLVVDAIGRVKREFIKPLMNVISMSIINEPVANEFIRAGTWDKLQSLTSTSTTPVNFMVPPFAARGVGVVSNAAAGGCDAPADYTDAVNLVRQKLLEGDTAFKFATVGVLSPLNRVTDGFYDFSASSKNGNVTLAKSFPALEDVFNNQSRIFAVSSNAELPVMVFYISTRDPLPPPSLAKEPAQHAEQQESQTELAGENADNATAPERAANQVTSPASASKKSKSGASANSGGSSAAGSSPAAANPKTLSRQSTQQPKDQEQLSTSLKPKKQQAKSTTGGDNSASSVSLTPTERGKQADEQHSKSGAKSPLLRSNTVTLGGSGNIAATTSAGETGPAPSSAPPAVPTPTQQPVKPPPPPQFHPPCDTRLLDFARAVHQELRCYQYLVNRTVVLARMVVERMGGVVRNIDQQQQTAASHLQQLQKYLQSHCIPLGFVRQAGFHQRALLLKFCADFFHIPCSLHRSTTPATNIAATTAGSENNTDGNHCEDVARRSPLSKQQAKPNTNKLLPPLTANRFASPSTQRLRNKMSTADSSSSDVRYWNIIYVGKPSEPFLVDLMFSPGSLIPMHLPAAKSLVDFYCQPNSPSLNDSHQSAASSNDITDRESGIFNTSGESKTMTYQEYLKQLPNVELKLPHEIPKLRGADGNSTAGGGADGANSADGDQSSTLGGASSMNGGSIAGKRGRKGLAATSTALSGDGASSSAASGASPTPMFTGAAAGGGGSLSASAAAGSKSVKPGGLTAGMNAANIIGNTLSAKTPTPSSMAAASTTAANAKGAKKHAK